MGWMKSALRSVRKFVARASHYIFVCRCISCEEIIAENEVLCEDCAEEYRAALLSECGVCGHSLSHCLCIDRALERSGIHRHVKLYRYLTDDDEAVGNRILYRIKRFDVRVAFRFLGGELARCVRSLIDPTPEDYTVVFLPRTPKRVLHLGFDQSKNLATEMAEALELPLCAALKRKGKAKTQKALHTVRARNKNAEDSLRLGKTAHAIAGKRVLLVDDIVTSGASMRAAAKLLRKAGAREIIAVSVAVVTRTRNLRAEAAQNSRLPFYMR